MYELRDDEIAVTVLGQGQGVLQAGALPLKQHCGRHGFDEVLQQPASNRAQRQGHESVLYVVAVKGIEKQQPLHNHGGAQETET